MTKIFETTGKVQRPLGLFLWFGALLLVLYGTTGCSSDQHLVASSGHTIDPGLLGSAVVQAEAADVTVGTTGEPGRVVANQWTRYRDFKFDSKQANLRVSDANKVFEIAIYMKANPTMKVGFDGSMEPLNQDLSDQRVATVRDALIEAGVPKSRIQAGVCRDGKSAHDGRVAVLIRTSINPLK